MLATLREVFFNLPALAAVAAGAVFMAVAFGLRAGRGRTALWALLYLALLLHLVVFLNATLAYTVYPYEGKTVVEGVLLHNSLQYLQGEQPYAPPDQLPCRSLVYPPAYDMALAGWLAVMGPTLYAARLFSLLCALATAFVCGLAVWRTTKHPPSAILGGLLVVCFYGVTGHWIEQVRNDALMALLLALGMLLTARAVERRRMPVAGLVALLLAVYTKQVAIFAPLAVIAYLWFHQSRRQAVIWAGAFGLAALAIFGAMEFWSGGWFGFYILKVPFRVGADWSKFDLASTFFGAIWILLWAVLIVRVPAFQKRPAPPAARLQALFLALAAPFCLLQSFKWGAALNAFAPAVPVFAVLGGCAFHELWRRFEGRDWLHLGLLGLALMQVAMLSYQPMLPSAADIRAQQRIREWVSAAPGDAFVSVFSSHTLLAGKKYFGDDVQVGDIAKAGEWRGGELVEKVREQGFALMVLRPQIEPADLADAVKANYVAAERIPMRTSICRWPYMDVYVPRNAPWRPEER